MEPIYPHDDEHEKYDKHSSDAVNNDSDSEEACEGRPRNLNAIAGWLYDKAVSGIAGIKSAETLAARYLADARGDPALAACSLQPHPMGEHQGRQQRLSLRYWRRGGFARHPAAEYHQRAVSPDPSDIASTRTIGHIARTTFLKSVSPPEG